MIRKHLTLRFTTLILIAFVRQSCANSKNDWTIKYRGKQTKLFTLKNPNNLKVTITNYGGKVVSLIVPDKNGKFEDIVLEKNVFVGKAERSAILSINKKCYERYSMPFEYKLLLLQSSPLHLIFL